MTHLALDRAPAILFGCRESTDGQRSLSGLPAFDAFDKLVGKAQSVTCPQLSWAWGYNADGTVKYQPLYTPRLQADYDRGRLSVLTWISFNGGDRSNPTQIQLFNNDSILAGKHDAYLKQFGLDAAAYGHRFVIRFNPEFNGWWEGPFSEYDNTGKLANGNSDGSFARMWRYVVDLVRAQGATNIDWFWCANPLSTTVTSPTYFGKLPHFYPDDNHVDYVGYDVYNKAGTANSNWLTFQQCLEGIPGAWPTNSLAPMLAVAPGTNWMIGEAGGGPAKAGDTTVGAGDRSAWAQGMLDICRTRYSFIRSIQYFNVDPWTVDATMAVGLAKGLASPSYPAAPLMQPDSALYRIVDTPDLDSQIAAAQQAQQAQSDANLQLVQQVNDLTTKLTAAQTQLTATQTQYNTLHDATMAVLNAQTALETLLGV